MLFLLYTALAVLAAAYFLAKRGLFKGDVFVASSVLSCAHGDFYCLPSWQITYWRFPP
jgi:hypothetical protein